MTKSPSDNDLTAADCYANTELCESCGSKLYVLYSVTTSERVGFSVCSVYLIHSSFYLYDDIFLFCKLVLKIFSLLYFLYLRESVSQTRFSLLSCPTGNASKLSQSDFPLCLSIQLSIYGVCSGTLASSFKLPCDYLR